MTNGRALFFLSTTTVSLVVEGLILIGRLPLVDGTTTLGVFFDWLFLTTIGGGVFEFFPFPAGGGSTTIGLFLGLLTTTGLLRPAGTLMTNGALVWAVGLDGRITTGRWFPFLQTTTASRDPRLATVIGLLEFPFLGFKIFGGRGAGLRVAEMTTSTARPGTGGTTVRLPRLAWTLSWRAAVPTCTAAEKESVRGGDEAWAFTGWMKIGRLLPLGSTTTTGVLFLAVMKMGEVALAPGVGTTTCTGGVLLLACLTITGAVTLIDRRTNVGRLDDW